jgi:DNA-binding CsgD family transcriptional regulator
VNSAVARGIGSDLFGRTAELRTLIGLVEAARGGSGGGVVVRGPEGIGRTSVLDALCRAAAGTGVTVLRTTCREPDVPYGVVRELFRAYAPHSADSAVLARDAKWALPALVGGDVPSADSGHAVLRGLYWLTVNLSDDSPLLIVVDDSHRCDVATLGWLDFLLRRVAGLPVLVVLAHRAGTGGFVLDEITGREDRRVVELGPLPRDAVAELVTRELGEPPSPPFVEACVEVSGGNPMLLTRLLGALHANAVVPTGDAAAQVERLGAEVLAAPALERLSGQPEFVRDTARAVAVLGDVDATVVGALFGQSVHLVRTAVDALRRADVLTADGRGFRNDQVRQAVLDELSAEELTALRLRAARLLSDQGHPFEEVAPLVMELPALSEVWMFCTLREAARKAASGGAPEVGVRYLRRVLDAVPGHQETLSELVDVLALSDPSSAMDELAGILGQTSDPRAVAALAVRFGVIAAVADRTPDALPRLLHALRVLTEEVGAAPDGADRQLLTLVRATSVMAGMMHVNTTRQTLEWGAHQPVPNGESSSERSLLRNLAYVRSQRGDSALDTVRLVRRGLGERPPLDDPSVLPAVMFLHHAGESAAALGYLDDMVADSRSRGDAPLHALSLTSRGSVHCAMGNLADAAADAEIALAIAETEVRTWKLTWPRITLASVLVRQADPERAEALLAPVDGSTHGIEHCQYLVASAEVRWALGDHEQALALLRRCEATVAEIGGLNPTFAQWWVPAACVLVELGRSSEAADLVDFSEELASRWGTAESVGLAMLTRGVLTPGRRGVDLLGGAAHELAASSARLSQVLAEYRHGRALLELGDEKGARKQLRRAVDLAMSCGYLSVGRTARELLVAAGGRMRELRGEPTEVLTGSERRVATMAAAGRTNREIAESLFVTMRTVESHLSNVYRKLWVGERAELAAALRGQPSSVPAANGRSGSR